MLEHLGIRDIVLIEHLDLDFDAGLNVLTGETGAGKSILLDALGFALGRRDAKGLVRAGAAEGVVEATLRCGDDHPARAIMEEAGLRWTDGELVLRRLAAADGPSRAFVNDQRVNAETLRLIGETLVEVHGQHDDRGLLNARGHRSLLDHFAGAETALTATRDAWRIAREAREAVAAAEARIEAAAKDREYLEHAVAELQKFGPEAGEDDRLDSQRRLMQGAERIREDVAKALEALGGDGADGAMADAARRLGDAAVSAEGRLDAPLEALSRAIEALAEATSGVERSLDDMSFDPLELERVEERLFALRALARKHECQPDALSALADEMAERLKSISAGEGQLASLRKASALADAAYDKAAAILGEMRREAADALDKAVATELPSLKMERARFATDVSEATRPGPDGRDEVAFTISTNPGAPAGPLATIASGGELSRFLLALKVSLAGRMAGGTMIFDEIDRGVGGATADAVGRRLARLATSAQVLVVTHSPQVAARGTSHFRIEKAVSGGTARTGIVALTGDERRDEIARMLAGDQITDAARGAADALMGG